MIIPTHFDRMKKSMTVSSSDEKALAFGRKLRRYCELHGDLVSSRSDSGPFLAASLDPWHVTHFLDHDFVSVFAGADCFVFCEPDKIYLLHEHFWRIRDDLDAAMVLEDLADA